MSSNMLTSHPFIYGRPVRPGEFLDREAELRTVFNRLRNCESTAVVGEPHIGKSSLLLQIADEDTLRIYLGDDARCLVVSSRDLHSISSDYTPAGFWEEMLEPLEEQPGHATTVHRLEQASEASYAPRSLERLFENLRRQGRRLVLLLDEFERLLTHPNFQDPSFFALLRSLATRTGGLALVTASRLSLAGMNERGRKLLDTGSPFFNNSIEVRLGPFDERTVGLLLNRAGDALSSVDRRFVRRVAGRQPFLLQALTAFLIEARIHDCQADAAERFYEAVASHFNDLWDTLDDRSRTAAVILGLVELGKRAQGRKFACGEIENVPAFGPELRKLAKVGLAEKVGEGWQFDREHLLLWRGERWTVGAQAFTWWVRDVIIAKSRRVSTCEDWLAKKRYRFLLTQEQWDLLVGAIRDAPGWAGQLTGQVVGALATSLFDELAVRE